MKKISVIIPTLNEAQGIVPLVKRCKAFADEVLIVDGASRDGTDRLAAQNGATVITETRKGYGQAYLTGFAAAKGEIIATSDGDGTYPVHLIPEIAERLIKEDLSFISCSRFPLVFKESMPRTNQVGNSVLSLTGSILWGHRFQDILSGMWIFKKEILKDLELCSTNWNLSQEIKIAAYCKLKGRFKEVHIPYHERAGVPKLNPWSVGAQNLAFFFAQRFGLHKPRDRK